MRLPAAVVLAGLLGSCGGNGSNTFEPPPPPFPLTAISSVTPYAAGCGGSQPGTNYRNAEVEPFAAVNPANPDNLIAVWQQDRWSNGGARGLLAAVSFDGGDTWSTRIVPFSICGGGTPANGGDYARASDPWVTFTPDGKAFFMALAITDADDVSAMLVSRSLDGGDTWSDPETLIRNADPSLFNDKNTITADPNDANAVYAVWDRLDFNNLASNDDDTGPTLFTRTLDAGDSWEPAREIHDPGFGQTVGNVIAVSGTTLVNLFVEIDFDTEEATLRVIRSLDQGATWLPAVTIAELLSVDAEDPHTGANLRVGDIVPAMAVRPGDGQLAVAWGDSRFSAGSHNGIAVSYSDDAGLSWSAPVAVNGDPGAVAFTPALAYLDDGRLAVGYYDLRENTPDWRTLLASQWLAVVGEAGVDEQLVSGPFDMDFAPNARGLFLGDYMAMLPSGAGARPVFVQTGSGTSDRTNVMTVHLDVPATVTAKALRAPMVDPNVPLDAAARARVHKTLEPYLPRTRHNPPLP